MRSSNSANEHMYYGTWCRRGRFTRDGEHVVLGRESSGWHKLLVVDSRGVVVSRKVWSNRERRRVWKPVRWWWVCWIQLRLGVSRRRNHWSRRRRLDGGHGGRVGVRGGLLILVSAAAFGKRRVFALAGRVQRFRAVVCARTVLFAKRGHFGCAFGLFGRFLLRCSKHGWRR